MKGLIDLQQLYTDPLFTTWGSKLSLFSLYGQRFPRYRLILKIVILGHEAWNLKKVS